MKKLMIAMSAAAMFSLSAKAATTLQGGMDFQGYDENATIAAAADPGDESGKIFWGSAGGDSAVAVDGDNKYLKVDTTDVLVRKTAAAGANEVAEVAIPGNNGDITISTKVQFTAADEAPEASTGDKLLVWMRAAEEAEGTEGEEGYKAAVPAAVMVTDKTGPVVAKEIAAEQVEAFTAAWHTLEIKAVAAGTEAQPTATFTVSIDGVVVSDTEANPISFKSLVTGGDYAQTIESIGFKGTGAVDDIAFTSNEGVVVPDVTVTVVATEGATIYVDEECSIPYASPIVVKAGQTVTVYVGDDEGTANVTSSVGTVGAYDIENCGWPVTYTTVAETTAVTMTITVTGGEEPQPTPVVPGTGDTVVTAADADAAKALVTITAPATITGDAATAYVAMFTKTATPVEGQTGKFTVAIALTSEGEAALQASVNAAVADEDILDTTAEEVEITAIPGFYYAIVGGTELNEITTAGDAVQATDTTVTLPKPDLGETTKAFYKVTVSVSAPAK